MQQCLVPQCLINFSFVVDTAEEHRCMVRLMKMSLGLNDQTAEAFLSPNKMPPRAPEENEIQYENIEVEEVYL